MNYNESLVNTQKNSKAILTLITASGIPDQRQIDHEIYAHREAVARIQREVLKLRQQSYYSSSIQARSTVAELVLPFSDALVDRVNKYSGKQTGPRPFINYQLEMKQLVEEIEPEIISLIFLKSAFDAAGAYESMTVQRVGSFIGSRLEDEARFRYYESLGCERLSTAAHKRVNNKESNPHYRRKSTRMISEKIATEEGLPLWEAWSTPKKCGITFFLLEIAKEAGWFTSDVASVAPNRTQTFLHFTPAFLAQQAMVMEQVEALSFYSWPLIVPPIPWQTSTSESRSNFTGGYHSDLCRTQLPLCRGRHYRTVFSSATTEFLNTLGSTPWCVDRRVFEVARQCFADGVSVGSLKAVFDHSMIDQEMPQHLLSLPSDHEDRRQWRKVQKELHEQRQKAQKRSIRSREALSLATKYLNYPRFYLSWSCDYRGRAYSQQPFLQPQSTEVEKSLLRFADGCKLDASGLRWVETAIGASFIGTKGSYDQRRDWCQQNQSLIAAVASNPLDTITLWEKADEPWHFLQLCLEYNAVVVEQSKALWDVAIQVDATSSGLQLLSGCLLDPVGCKFSNVTDSNCDKPQDAYMEVVTRARSLAEAKEEWKKYVPFLNDRSLGKASLLVAVYGGSHGTRTQRVIKTLMSSGLFPEPLGWKDANVMASIIQEASQKTFPQAFAALKWIRSLGSLALKSSSEEFVWSTPCGDKIALREFERDSIVISTKHLGRIKVAKGYSRKLAANDMLKALAPSYVHSLDATVLKAALGDWKHPVACIHDCVAVLPTDMDRMLDRLRKAFVFTVADNPLQRLATDLGVNSEQLKPLRLGNADLSRISPFLFN